MTRKSEMVLQEPDLTSLPDKFRGCLLGAAVGDMIGAVVEAESPEYIAHTYRTIDEMLATELVPEFSGLPWRVGRFTDDTQMTTCVAEWLIAGESPSPERLLVRFTEEYEPSRRYGPGTEAILRMFPQHRAQWRALSTAMFPEGSYGNGSAMRVAPIGLAYFDDVESAVTVAIESSRPTHSHSLAYQGAVLQAMAIATSTASSECSPPKFLRVLRSGMSRFTDLMQDTSKFGRAIDAIEQGLSTGASCREMAQLLGTGVDSHERSRWPSIVSCVIRTAMKRSSIRLYTSVAISIRSPQWRVPCPVPFSDHMPFQMIGSSPFGMRNMTSRPSRTWRIVSI